MIFLKDVDGLYTADPAHTPEAALICRINFADLAPLRLPTLPIDWVVLDLMACAKLAPEIQVANGLVSGNLARAFDGEPVGSVIHG
jgi:molybdenum storage protein